MLVQFIDLLSGRGAFHTNTLVAERSVFLILPILQNYDLNGLMQPTAAVECHVCWQAYLWMVRLKIRCRFLYFTVCDHSLKYMPHW